MRKQYTKTGPIAFTTVAADEVTLSSDVKERVYIGSVEVGNSSGADAACGFGVKLPNAMWGAGQWDDSATDAEFISDTTDAQDAGTSDFALTTLTNDDGFVVYADQKFNIVGITIGTAANDAGTAVYEYFNGTTWATLNLHTTPTFTSTGVTYIGFHEPTAWAVTSSASTIPDGKYAIRVTWSTAPSTTAGLATSLFVAKLIDYIEAVGDGKSVVMMTEGEIMLPFTGVVLPFCSTANNANWINLGYRLG